MRPALPALPLVLALALAPACGVTDAWALEDEPPPSPPRAEVVPLEHAPAVLVAELVDHALHGAGAARIVADPRTNAVILAGTADQIAKMRSLVERLDVPAPGTEAPPTAPPPPPDEE